MLFTIFVLLFPNSTADVAMIVAVAAMVEIGNHFHWSLRDEDCDVKDGDNAFVDAILVPLTILRRKQLAFTWEKQ